ncbi:MULTISPECIES: RimK family alpha-L-glutamate ligase [unclassified Mesorhizobium]|uniref:ATP-grasp domain-containing protein n=1 Tax=unclassified Mesorhizobium TaxID=325217 RepID=UPI00112B19B8|nr:MULTISPECIES: RimK family alpha-L-glutamate ligase [unclassified Mesorhizobium]MBZ9961094.1 RimK family alpha-L-glutamate ligase [Mesorhizobium sp. BR1-1-14]TPM07551.1 RimK family alpha-L-glutamate ligase [Mesorhizobium sp. B2-3-8]TPM16261.1 RimK family alpha-L-glutamate ligase [Mesorhizobium sp. B2-3-7]TPN09205.1 RimK family alpha-L-glutamate ligase [Mesorhizobium sp. B2-1-3]
MIPRILIVSDNSDTGSSGLAARLGRRGAIVATVPLAAIAFDTGSPGGLSIPGFGGALPDAVLVRSIAAGSFEAITRRLGVLHALSRLSVPVWNSAQAVERCVDKSMTTFLLKNAGLATPPTFAVEGLAAAKEIAAQELPKGPLVLKPLFGAQGRGIRLIRTLSDLPAADEVNSVYYLQHYVSRAGPPFRDFRVFVCAGETVAMMSRSSDDWITNVNRGGVPEPVSGPGKAELASLAVAASAAVDADFAGVDIVRADDGSLFVLEVNSMPAWSGLQSVVAVNIAEAIADALLKFLADRTEATAVPRPFRFTAPANS